MSDELSYPLENQVFEIAAQWILTEIGQKPTLPIVGFSGQMSNEWWVRRSKPRNR